MAGSSGVLAASPGDGAPLNGALDGDGKDADGKDAGGDDGSDGGNGDSGKKKGGTSAGGKAGKKKNDEEEEEEDDESDQPLEEEPSENLNLGDEIPKASRKTVEDAIAAFKKAEGAKPEDRSRLMNEASKRLETACSNAPKSPVSAYYLGRALQSKRSFSRARTALEKALALNPKFHEAHVELGNIAAAQKDITGSLKHYDKALELHPKYTEAMDMKAMTLIRQGKLEEARSLLGQVQKLARSKDRGRWILMLAQGIKGPGWGPTFTRESENYIVKTPVSQGFADEVAENAELMRKAYKRVFPSVPTPDRKYEIWVYPDRSAYMRAGSPPTSGGYYNTVIRRLFLYKYPKAVDTFLVLRHEAFHQFLDDYMERAPSWFNEGLADYFGAFVPKTEGKKQSMTSKANSWRLETIKYLIQEQRTIPSAELMVMSQAEMYDPTRISVGYCQSWAMFYFIFENTKHDYKGVVNAYFNALTKGNDPDKAFEMSFGKVDLAQFDKQWKNFIMNVK